jgi:hypothetical protein
VCLSCAGVPFVLRAGKALNERSVVVRMQLHAHPVPLFGPSAAHNEMRNEFVMRLQPGEQQQPPVVVLFVLDLQAGLCVGGGGGGQAGK